MRTTRRLLLAAALLAVALPSCAPRRDTFPARVERRLADPELARDPEHPRLAKFYADRNGRPAWLENRRPSTDALELRRALRALPGDGLTGWEGDVAALDSALAVRQAWFGAPNGDDSLLAVLDVRLTRAWLAAAERLRHGVLPEANLDRAWRQGDKGLSPERRLARALEAHAVAESLAASAPPDIEYARLRAALSREVLEFQRARGLDTTGVADTRTFAAMDTAERARVITVGVNLERRRWLPRVRPLPRVEVNIADATLAARADTGEALRMRVVIGQPDHPTPVFSSAIAWMDLNPTWTLTPRVIGEEIVSALRRHPDYLETHHMMTMRPMHGVMVPVPHAGARWDSVASDTFRTFVRQSAGPWNPLGRIRFMLPNPFQVYLHDTNQRGLFKKDYRARSHGCVRLEKPLELAAWLRSLRTPTPLDSIRAAVRDSTARRWDVVPHVPVDVLYWTAFVDEHGALQIRPDLYGFDRRLLAAIASGHTESFELNPKIEWNVQP